MILEKGIRIAISGASGFIGHSLCAFLQERGVEVIVLSRDLFAPDRRNELRKRLDGSHAVINLAGATINHRWTESYKALLLSSRINVTRALVEAINTAPRKPELFISTSAIGYYPTTGCHTESAQQPADTFLGELCMQWEHEALRVCPPVRVVITRFGVVCDAHGGAFKKLMQSLPYGMATQIGKGSHTFSWIGLQDLLRAYEFVVGHSELKGAVNFTAPDPTSYSEIAQQLALRFGSRLTLKIPEFIFHTAYGEAADFILSGQCARPYKLISAGFKYNTPTMQAFISSLETGDRASKTHPERG